MSRRPAEDRALTAIGHALCASDQQLAALFALFGWLYRDEEMPGWERRRAHRWGLAGAVLPVLVQFGLAALAAGWQAAARVAARARREVRHAASGTREPRPGRIPLEP